MKVKALCTMAALLALAGSAAVSCQKDNSSQNQKKKEVEVDDESRVIRVMQFNILQSTSETAGREWATVRKEPCMKMFKEVSPDIVAVEECRKSQCNDIASALPEYGQIKYPKDGIESNGGQRNLIMYKKSVLELVSWDKFWFSVDGTPSGDRFGDPETTQKMTIFAKFKHKPTGKYFWMYCTHFFAVTSIKSRGECVRMSLESIKEQVPSDGTVFFCGDLNLHYGSEDTRACLQPLFDYMKWSAQEAPKSSGVNRCTYNKWGKSDHVLDYIFFRGATAINYVVESNNIKYFTGWDMRNGNPYLSDHYPIYSDFLLPE